MRLVAARPAPTYGGLHPTRRRGAGQAGEGRRLADDLRPTAADHRRRGGADRRGAHRPTADCSRPPTTGQGRPTRGSRVKKAGRGGRRAATHEDETPPKRLQQAQPQPLPLPQPITTTTEPPALVSGGHVGRKGAATRPQRASKRYRDRNFRPLGMRPKNQSSFRSSGLLISLNSHRSKVLQVLQ